MKKQSNDIVVSSRILGLLGRRKVDPTTEAMREYKGTEYKHVVIDECGEPADDDVVVYGGARLGKGRVPLHLQQSGRLMHQPGLDNDEKGRLIKVLERMLGK